MATRFSMTARWFLFLRAVEPLVMMPSQLALVGFSQGAMMSLHIAPRRAPAIAGVVAISGRLLAPELLATETVSRPPVPPHG